MTKLEISKDFTLEDIRRIRDYAYYRRLEIGNEAYDKEVHIGAVRVLSIINNLKTDRQGGVRTQV
ncbi:MAG: hypothetical protein LBL49_00920 [Clostridiales Family XIII bacterium]|jgi:hypothetical protein|nr:hypothetical protein [Clostridiales Family XIII bacterium]